MNVSLIIKAVDQASATIARVTGATRNLGTRGLSVVTAASGRADRALGRIGLGTDGRLNRIAGAAARAAGRGGLLALESSARGAGKALDFALRKGGELSVRAAKWGALGVAGGLAYAATDIIRTASKFEQFQVILENTEGSADKAKVAMAWVSTFAKTTPYEVGEVMQAFVRLRAYGIDPTKGTMTSLGNAASGMGKDLMAAVEMIADAQTGEFERLKEFGIKAKQAGNQVTFSWSKNGKDMSRTSTKAASDIRKTITGIFDQNFGAMMDRQSKTFAGMWSNLKDTFTAFELQVANSGVFDYAKGKLTELLTWVTKLAADGTLKRWAEIISKKFVEMAISAEAFIRGTDWEKVGRDLSTVGSAAMVVANAILKIAGAIGSIPSLPAWMGGGSSLGLLNPLGSAMGRILPFLGQDPDPAAAPAPANQSRGRPLVMRPGVRQPVWPSGSGAPGRHVVGGKVSLQIDTAPGVKVRTAGVTSDNRNVPIEVRQSRTGRVAAAA